VVAKVRERLAVSKQATHSFHILRFNLKKSNKRQSKEKYRADISNNFAAVQNLDTEVDTNKAWETIKGNIKISTKESLDYYELKKHKTWFDGGCSELLDHRKQAKLLWIHDPSKINGDNLNSVRHEARRHFRNKKREYLKDKINEFATNSKNKSVSNLYKRIN
jgi:hypothetical protein